MSNHQLSCANLKFPFNLLDRGYMSRNMTRLDYLHRIIIIKIQGKKDTKHHSSVCIDKKHCTALLIELFRRNRWIQLSKLEASGTEDNMKTIYTHVQRTIWILGRNDIKVIFESQLENDYINLNVTDDKMHWISKRTNVKCQTASLNIRFFQHAENECLDLYFRYKRNTNL